MSVADPVLERFPNLAVAHLHRAKNLKLLSRVTEAEAELRRGLSCDSDVDVRTRLLTELGTNLLDQNRSEAHDLFEQAADLNGNLTAAACAKFALRRQRK